MVEGRRELVRDTKHRALREHDIRAQLLDLPQPFLAVLGASHHIHIRKGPSRSARPAPGSLRGPLQGGRVGVLGGGLRLREGSQGR